MEGVRTIVGNIYGLAGREERPLGGILRLGSDLRGVTDDNTVELGVLSISVLHVERPGGPGGKRAVRVVEQLERLVTGVRDGGDDLEAVDIGHEGGGDGGGDGERLGRGGGRDDGGEDDEGGEHD